MPRYNDRCGDRPAGRARAHVLPAVWAAVVTAAVSAVAVVLCEPAAAATVAESFDPPGSRWVVYLAVGGTLVVSGGGYLYLRFFSKDSHDDEDDESDGDDAGGEDHEADGEDVDSLVLREDDRLG